MIIQKRVRAMKNLDEPDNINMKIKLLKGMIEVQSEINYIIFEDIKNLKQIMIVFSIIHFLVLLLIFFYK